MVAFRGSVELTLFSPMGTRSLLMTERPLDSVFEPNNGTLTWRYKTLQMWGENPCSDKAFGNQPWRLAFKSTNTSVTGTSTVYTRFDYGNRVACR